MPALYLNGFETSARLESERIIITQYDPLREEKQDHTVHLRDIDRAIFTGQPAVRMSVFHALLKRGIPISLLSESGRWLGGVVPAEHGDISRRLRQYELAANETIRRKIAAALVRRKLLNSRRCLQRLAANRSESSEQHQQKAVTELADLAKQVTHARELDEIRGYEGMGAAIYFSRLKDFFPEETPFEYRSRRPPHNEANALLSWCYAILTSEIDTRLRVAGLDPGLGFLHGILYNRPSLSLDLLEVYRAPICDLLALKLLNHKVLQKMDFTYDAERGGFYLKKEAKRTFFIEYERSMERLFRRPGEEKHTTFRRSIEDDIHNIIKTLEKPEEFQPDFFAMP
ncbi:MAG: CRISPR-associated endonuclease Cas1 [Lentisphaerae bacterium]|nr:MAG: CRISPR-associated endonuclease Cas1 [Lentisphaerota bacterium]